MRDEKSLGTRGLESFDGLVERQVPTRLAVELTAEERGLADEQVGVTRCLDELGRRR